MLTFFPELGAMGPWMAATAKIITVALLVRWRFKSNRWMRIDLFKRRIVGLPEEIKTIAE